MKLIKMLCRATGKEENQIILKSRDEGLDLKCSGCGQLHSYEIGFFAEYFKGGD